MALVFMYELRILSVVCLFVFDRVKVVEKMNLSGFLKGILIAAESYSNSQLFYGQ